MSFSPFSGKRFLVVEDDLTFREVLSANLRSLGAAVEEADDGIVGLGMLAAEKFDLVLSDIRMPKMDGLQLCSQVREQSSLPFVLMTGATGLDDNAGPMPQVDALVQKPFAMDKLVTTLDQCLQIKAREMIVAGAPDPSRLMLNAIWSAWFVGCATYLKIFDSTPAPLTVLFSLGMPLAFRAGFFTAKLPKPKVELMREVSVKIGASTPRHP